jgi:hypothetical protein
MSDRYLWLLFVGLAGLSWGTYVPLIFYGGNELSSKPGGIGPRLLAILCVGIAYFVIGVLVPVVLFFTRQADWPEGVTNTGLVFSGLAGAAGALGAICVIFASKGAVDAARSTDEYKKKAGEVQSLRDDLKTHPERKEELQAQIDEEQGELTGLMARYRLFIAPLIFGLAPVINTLISMLWHPKRGEPFHFGLTVPDWKLWVGIVLVGLGSALVLYSKEESEVAPSKGHARSASPSSSTPAPAGHPGAVKESKG